MLKIIMITVMLNAGPDTHGVIPTIFHDFQEPKDNWELCKQVAEELNEKSTTTFSFCFVKNPNAKVAFFYPEPDHAK